MSDIEGLQSRIMAALDQIGQGIDGLDAGGGDIDTLRQELADEKLANAQLEERVKALKAKLAEAEAAGAKAGSADEERGAGLRKLDAELQALRLANKHLRENNAALREANAEGVAEPHLINKAMMAELEGLRAVRASDRAEMDAVLAELDALVASAGDGSKMEDV